MFVFAVFRRKLVVYNMIDGLIFFYFRIVYACFFLCPILLLTYWNLWNCSQLSLIGIPFLAHICPSDTFANTGCHYQSLITRFCLNFKSLDNRSDTTPPFLSYTDYQCNPLVKLQTLSSLSLFFDLGFAVLLLSSLENCWLVVWVLWHINLCRLFNAKSIFIQIISSISNNSV